MNSWLKKMGKLKESDAVSDTDSKSKAHETAATATESEPGGKKQHSLNVGCVLITTVSSVLHSDTYIFVHTGNSIPVVLSSIYHAIIILF